MAWSLYSQEKELEPLKFSNGKTQEDIVNEVLKAINEGYKIIFIKGNPGTGKSAIALNISKEFNKVSIVVPVKALQEQYERDYTDKLHLFKNGKKLKITIINGRNNHKCVYADTTADDPKIPCYIDIKKENIELLKQYVKENPYVDEEEIKDIRDIRRMTVAMACPKYSPILPADMYSDKMKNVLCDHGNPLSYMGLKNQIFNLYQREKGCTYYEQFKSYINSDVIIFNSAKYLIENLLNRKPNTAVEIIDECDEFLDNLSNEMTLNLNRLAIRLMNAVSVESDENTKKLLLEMAEFTNDIIKDKETEKIIEKDEIVKLTDTKVLRLLKYFLTNAFLADYAEDDNDYLLNGFEVAKYFEGFFKETYLTFERNEYGHVAAMLVTINLDSKLKELLDKNKVFVMMSGTIHSEQALKTIFGINEFKVIEAEVKDQGKITKVVTGLERDFRYKNFKNGVLTREMYLKALSKCIEKAVKPILVHINSFSDLPNEEECIKYKIDNLQTQEKVIEVQKKYRKGELVRMFKEKKIDILYSTQCRRGVDFPGDICNSIVFTKFPYPSMSSIFWRVLKRDKPDYFTIFYFDKARREFKQLLYRGLRSKEDHIYLLSPDSQIFSRI